MLHIFLSNRHGDVRYGTSGKPVPGYDLVIRGDDGEPVSDGVEGSLWVRGPSAAVGYWNQREKSLATFHGPWTRTGDRYIRDFDGFFTYSGRGDDMLKVGGIWVSPFEVESALSSHEAVLEAAVVGHPDADQLIKPRAFVVLHDRTRAGAALEAELKAFVKGALAPYKYPRWIDFVTELPKTATGKIQRFRLRGGLINTTGSKLVQPSRTGKFADVEKQANRQDTKTAKEEKGFLVFFCCSWQPRRLGGSPVLPI